MKSIYWGSAILAIFAVACSSNSTNGDGSGGSVAAGGSSSTSAGGSSANATGGTTAGDVNTGGATVSTGGKGVGGTTAATGGRDTGGTTSQATGGKSPSGGSQATGGKSATGGTTADGTQATGGKSSTGGTEGGATGGKSATGGTNAGGQATGGKSAAGGASGGEQATGGKSATGGGTSAGGQSTGGTSSAGGGTAQSSGCGKTPTISSSQYNNGSPISITVGGKQRRYVLQVPTNYDKNKAYRLIVVYHQLDGNDKQMYNWQYYGLLPLSNNSTIFVAPNGQKNGSPCTGTGDGDSGCGWPNTSDSDLALADAVVAQVEENFCINTNSILATGWSYGGSMSYRTACSRPLSGTGTASWGVRAIAIYSAAQLSGNCTPNKPVAFYASHGTHDSVLNYDSMGLPLAQNFASANGCTWATPTKVSSGAHVCTNLTGCSTGYPLEFCSFNGDHTPFPDNGQSSGSWGPQEAWKFLSQY